MNHFQQSTNIKRFIFIVALFLIQFQSLNAQQVKVLFIGSSLTAFNNQPGMFYELANAAGKDVYVLNGARAGHNLTDHLSVNETLEKLGQEEWDYVILENGDYGLMSSLEKENVWATVDAFINIIISNHADTKIIFFMDWAMKNGVMQDGIFFSYEAYQQKIYEATLEIADSKNLMVAPIGSAWQDVFTSSNELELYAPDNGHPSLLGSYLGACVYYSTIFQESCSGNSFISSIPQEDALYLQTTASSTVLENLELWNLITGVDKEKCLPLDSFILYQNYPNPFNPSTKINFSIKETIDVNLSIYNSLGEKIYTIINNMELQSGTYSYSWNGKNNSGNIMSSGIYFYSLIAGPSSKTKMMVLLR